MPPGEEPTNMNPVALLKQSDVQVHSECGYLCDAERGYNCQTIRNAMAQGTRISVSLWVLVLLAASLLGSSPAGAQSLAEAALKEKDRRVKAQAAGPAKSYSTEDLASFHVEQPAAEANLDAVSKAGAVPSENASDAERAAASKEAYWRQRAFPVRQAVQAAEKQLTEFERTFTSRRPYEEARLKASLAMARQRLNSLEDEARRAGVPPGWLR
jgi:hypothetical protein